MLALRKIDVIYMRMACEGIPRAMSSPQVTTNRNRGHHPIISKKVKVLEAQMSLERGPKVQKGPAWLTVDDTPLGPSKVRPTLLIPEL